MKGKRGLVLSEIIFIFANLAIFLGLMLFVSRAGSGDSFLEQRYAKKIALLIDEAKTNTQIELDISELLERAGKNKYAGNIVAILENKVIVKVSGGKGYKFEYFSDLGIGKIEDRARGKLILDLKNEEENGKLV